VLIDYKPDQYEYKLIYGDAYECVNRLDWFKLVCRPLSSNQLCLL